MSNEIGDIRINYFRIGIAEEMVALMPNVQPEVIAGAGHMVRLERPLTFQQLVCQFASR